MLAEVEWNEQRDCEEWPIEKEAKRAREREREREREKDKEREVEWEWVIEGVWEKKSRRKRKKSV